MYSSKKVRNLPRYGWGSFIGARDECVDDRSFLHFLMRSKKKNLNESADWDWLYCRDQINQDVLGKSVRAAFFFDAGTESKAKNAGAFVRVVERKLKLKVKHRVRIYKTNAPGILYIVLPKWWQTPLRFSFFTALIRDSVDVKRTNSDDKMIERFLYQSQYFADEPGAFKCFLQGYTEITAAKKDWTYFPGWGDYVADRLNDDDLLTSPKDGRPAYAKLFRKGKR